MATRTEKRLDVLEARIAPKIVVYYAAIPGPEDDWPAEFLNCTTGEITHEEPKDGVILKWLGVKISDL